MKVIQDLRFRLAQEEEVSLDSVMMALGASREWQALACGYLLDHARWGKRPLTSALILERGGESNKRLMERVGELVDLIPGLGSCPEARMVAHLAFGLCVTKYGTAYVVADDREELHSVNGLYGRTDATPDYFKKIPWRGLAVRWEDLADASVDSKFRPSEYTGAVRHGGGIFWVPRSQVGSPLRQVLPSPAERAIHAVANLNAARWPSRSSEPAQGLLL